MEKSFVDKLGTVLSIIGTIVGIVASIIPDVFDCFSYYVLVCLSAVLAILAIFFWRAYLVRRRYAEGIEDLRKIHKEIILLQSRAKNLDSDKFLLSLHQICHKISKIFTKLRGKQISACIKYINETIDGGYYVQSLCRDADSFDRNDIEPIESDKDYIQDNSDFSSIMKDITKNLSREQIFFFSNNLPSEYGYLNSHLNESKLKKRLFRNYHWPLPYKSTIIVPILSVSKRTVEGTLYAFICIDSAKTNAFDKTTDIVILQAISLQLLPIIEFICNNHLKHE
ncbi:MAG: hypothetical protein E7080_10815 [Bacteroidales bacterium]|nr:hypothetical protein [Bacteroidales bacterium]